MAKQTRIGIANRDFSIGSPELSSPWQDRGFLHIRDLWRFPDFAPGDAGPANAHPQPATAAIDVAAPVAAPGELTIRTDLADYAPGSTAYITMDGITAGATVRFEIDHVSDPGADGAWGTLDDVTYQLGGDGHDPWYVTDGGAGDLDGTANGTIQTSWFVNPDDSLDERFLLTGHVVDTGADGIAGTADDADAGPVASNTFTDSGGDYSIDFSVGNPDQYEKKRPSEFTFFPTGRSNDPIAGASDATAKESLSPKELALGQIVPFEVEISTGNSATFTGTMQFTVAWSTATSNGTEFGYDESLGLIAAFVDGLDPTTTDTDSTVSNFTWVYDPANDEIVGTITVTNLDPNTTSVIELWVAIDQTIEPGTNGNVPARLVSASEVGTGSKISTGAQTVPLLKVSEFITDTTDLSVVISDEPSDTNPVAGDDPEGGLRAGDEFTYTIVARNNSIDTVANGVILTDTLDANVDFVSATVNGASVTGVYDSVTHRVTVDLGFLERADSATNDFDNNTATVLVTVRIKSGVAPSTTLTNTATITSLTGEATPADNTNTETTVLSSNLAPVAVDDTGTTGEDTTLSVLAASGLLSNDSDPEGQPLSVTGFSVGGVSHAAGATASLAAGDLTINTDGSYTFVPAADFNGDAPLVTYTVADSFGSTSTATLSLAVTPINDDPVAANDAADTFSDATVDIVLTANDTDADGDDLTIDSIDTTGLLGIVTILDGDTVRYDPNGAFDGLGQGDTATETFTYTVRDGNGGTSTATATVTIEGLNDAPVAVNDTTATEQAEAVTFDLLANDSDPNGDSLSITANTQPLNGTLVFNGDGTVTYDPDDAFFGTDSFQYTISDGRGGSATAKATITVDRNFAPAIPEPVVFFAPENQTRAANLQAFDPDGDPVTYSIVGGADAALFTIDAATGAMDFLVAPDFEAPSDSDGDNRYQVQVGLQDALHSISQVVTVNVTDVDDTPNRSPVITTNGSADMSLPLLINAKGVILDIDATDEDGDTLQFRLFGEDASKFSLDLVTGELTLPTPLTNPRGSFDGDFIYELDVLVTDGNGGEATIGIDYILFTAG